MEAVHKKKKRNCRFVDFDILTNHRIKLKENDKRDKFLNVARELKKQWNMKMTVIAKVIGALVTGTKGFVKGIEDLEIRG